MRKVAARSSVTDDKPGAAFAYKEIEELKIIANAWHKFSISHRMTLIELADFDRRQWRS
jgi:hypothetical protein